MKHAREIAQVLHAKTLGTEHVAPLSSGRPWDLSEPSHGVCRLCLTEQEQGVPIASLRKNLKTRQAGTRMISKPFGVSIALKT